MMRKGGEREGGEEDMRRVEGEGGRGETERGWMRKRRERQREA